MSFKGILEFFTTNRFTRFLALILLYVIVFVPTLAIGINIDNTALIFTPTIVFAICFFGQLFGDILNVETWMNNNFVTLLKRIIFFVAVIATSIFGIGYVLGGSVWETLMEKKASFFEIGFNIASTFAGPLTLLVYVFAYVIHSKNYHSEDNKKWMPLFFAIAYLASIIISIIVSLILTLVKVDANSISLILGLIVAALAILAIVVSIKTGTWVFEEEAPVYYGSSSSSYSNSTPNKSEYQKFREKCSNCVHLRDCTITDNTTWGDKRNVHYCNLTGKEIYSIYTDKCSRFKERY